MNLIISIIDCYKNATDQNFIVISKSNIMELRRVRVHLVNLTSSGLLQMDVPKWISKRVARSKKMRLYAKLAATTTNIVVYSHVALANHYRALLLF